MIDHCDRRITHLDDLDISFVLLNISSKFLLHVECYLLSPKRHTYIKICEYQGFRWGPAPGDVSPLRAGEVAGSTVGGWNVCSLNGGDMQYLFALSS